MTNLRATASAMVAPGKGILAVDESVATATKRLEGMGIASTPESRQAYREMLLTTPGLANYVSGAILFDETLRQTTADGVPFPDHLCDRGLLPGIKVDTGAKPLAGHPGETVTEGLDGLRERVAEYAGLGASFAKWRAADAIGGGGARRGPRPPPYPPPPPPSAPPPREGPRALRRPPVLPRP